MPLVDITLIHGQQKDVIRAIADGVHDALVEHFSIPQNDRFQVIHQKHPHELIYDREYLGGPRSDRFVLIRITVGKKRPESVIYSLYEGIATNLARTALMDPEDVFITLSTIALSDFSVAGGRRFEPPHLA